MSTRPISEGSKRYFARIAKTEFDTAEKADRAYSYAAQNAADIAALTQRVIELERIAIVPQGHSYV
jgi:hypothetical protein